MHSAKYFYILLCVAFAINIVSAQLPPRPIQPCNVTKTGWGGSSAPITFHNDLQDYVAVKITCYTTSSTTEVFNCYNKCDFLNSLTHGVTFCCSGVQDYSGNIYQSLQFKCTPGYSPGVILLDPRYPQFKGGYVLETDVWELVSQSLTTANNSHTMDVEVSYGVKQTDAYMLSDSVGVSTTQSWGNFAGYTKEISSSLTETFFHEVQIDESVTITQGFSFQALPVEQMDSIYQLSQKYETILPQSAYDSLNYYNENNQQWCTDESISCYSYSYASPYKYSAETYLQMVGVDTC